MGKNNFVADFMDKDNYNMENYDEARRTFIIAVPEYYNFGFDVIDAWARKDRNKLAMIRVS
jgi:acetyl-CoA synthetase